MTPPLRGRGAERAARGPVIGRKDDYGSKSRRRTEVAAMLYSLLESAKLASIEPTAYLREVVNAELRGERDEFVPAAATVARMKRPSTPSSCPG